MRKIFLNRLKIRNFRNHKNFDLEFKDQRTIILGSNGIGKSNLLESVEFISQLKSNRALSDQDLINNDSKFSSIYAQIDYKNDLKIELLRKGGKKVYVNDFLVRKQSDVKNYIRSVCFSSSDINIVKGDPSFRRNWLDKVVTQIEPVYTELLSRFNKLLKQRGHFWRSEISKDFHSTNLIDSFDSQMAIVGARIYRRRRRAINKIKPFVEYWHQYLSKSKENIHINYLSAGIDIKVQDDEKVITDYLLDGLLKQRETEKFTAKCSIGPHRDDVEFLINNISIRKFGSSGQQRTMVLALKMAELDFLKNIIAVEPILILDDVLAELDIVRQNLLLNSVGKDSQCLISATHLDKFNKDYLNESSVIHL